MPFATPSTAKSPVISPSSGASLTLKSMIWWCRILTMTWIVLVPHVTWAQSKLYNPLPLPLNQELQDTLSETDIPTGQSGFSRDYRVALQEGDQVAIEAKSDNFDIMVSLLGADGATVTENDDGPDGTTNSLLFTRIVKAGSYIIRIRGFGESAVGNFKLTVTRLKPA